MWYCRCVCGAAYHTTALIWMQPWVLTCRTTYTTFVPVFCNYPVNRTALLHPFSPTHPWCSTTELNEFGLFILPVCLGKIPLKQQNRQKRPWSSLSLQTEWFGIERTNQRRHVLNSLLYMCGRELYLLFWGLLQSQSLFFVTQIISSLLPSTLFSLPFIDSLPQRSCPWKNKS